MCTGTIFNIQRFSVHDGPGIRTTVFLKGCPLHCRWCHNPESLSSRPQIFFDERNCAGCRACVRACSSECHIFEKDRHLFRPDLCTGCQSCVQVCARQALQACGHLEKAEEILKIVLRDKDFYEESHGGLTLSGGEPLMQPDFAEAIMRGAHRHGISCVVESCGTGTKEAVRRILGEADLVLLDWKLSDERKLQEYTGAYMDVVYRTLDMLSELRKRVWLRCPVIPGVNDEETHFSHIAALARRYSNIEEIQVMPYHSFGNEKHIRLGSRDRIMEFRVPDEGEVAEWIRKISDFLPGVLVKKG